MTSTSFPKTLFPENHPALRYGCKTSTSWLPEHLLEYKHQYFAQHFQARTGALNTEEKPAGQGHMQIPAPLSDGAEAQRPLSGRDRFRSFKMLCCPPAIKLRLFLY